MLLLQEAADKTKGFLCLQGKINVNLWLFLASYTPNGHFTPDMDKAFF
jgi:hypothetical protein